MQLPSSIGLPIEQSAVAVMIVVSRVSGLLLVAPFFGSGAVAPRIKVGAALLLTLLLLPLVHVPSSELPAPRLIAILLGEFGVGFLLGFTLQLFVEAGQIAGQVCGVQMGFSLASVINPVSQADSAVLSIFYELIVLLLFIQLRVPQWLLRGLARSFQYVPPGHFSLTWPAVHSLFEFAVAMFVAGLQIAAPVLVASLFADVALGFIGKASPQLPILFIGISLKNLLGLALMCGAVAFWPRFFDARFGRALEASERILKLAH